MSVGTKKTSNHRWRFLKHLLLLVTHALELLLPLVLGDLLTPFLFQVTHSCFPFILGCTDSTRIYNVAQLSIFPNAETEKMQKNLFKYHRTVVFSRWNHR